MGIVYFANCYLKYTSGHPLELRNIELKPPEGLRSEASTFPEARKISSQALRAYMVTQQAHNVVSTYIYRYMDVLNVRWTLFWRCVPAGYIRNELECWEWNIAPMIGFDHLTVSVKFQLGQFSHLPADFTKITTIIFFCNFQA